MLSLDSLVFDLILPGTARPTPEQVVEALGGEDIAKTRAILDVDLDVPQIEAEISPTFLLRRRGDRRILVVAEGPLRENPRSQPIVAKDLRPEKARLVKLVEATGARIGRLGAFGAWGDGVIVCRSARDLRAVLLLAWGLDPFIDLDGRKRGQQLSQREFEMKLAAFEKRLDELDDRVILGRVPPAALERVGPKDAELLVISLLSDKDGSWDIRKSYELEKRVGALDQFSRIPGARQAIVAAAETDTAPPPPPEAKDVPAPAPLAEPPEPPEPPRPVGPPIQAVDVGKRVILIIPGERLDSDTVTALGKRALDILAPKDAVTSKQRDQIHQAGSGFIAPLEFLSEVFLEGKPLDKRRFEAEAQPAGEGIRALEAHLPRYGTVRVLERGGKRWITSETSGDAGALLALPPKAG
jgi:hypothetical protein